MKTVSNNEQSSLSPPDPVSLPAVNPIVGDDQQGGAVRQLGLLAVIDHVAVEHVHMALSQISYRDINFTHD